MHTLLALLSLIADTESEVHAAWAGVTIGAVTALLSLMGMALLAGKVLQKVDSLQSWMQSLNDGKGPLCVAHTGELDRLRSDVDRQDEELTEHSDRLKTQELRIHDLENARGRRAEGT